MKKPSFVIGKKQIVLAGMTLMLGIAVYANYAVTSSGSEIKTTDKIEKHSAEYGEAELVSADKNTSDYFAQARIDRMNARDEAKETLKTIINRGRKRSRCRRSCRHDRSHGIGKQDRITC